MFSSSLPLRDSSRSSGVRVHQTLVQGLADGFPVEMLAYEDYFLHSVSVVRIPVSREHRVGFELPHKFLLRHRAVPQAGIAQGYLLARLFEDVAGVELVLEVAEALGTDYTLRPAFGYEPVETVDVQSLAGEIHIGSYAVFLHFPALVVMMVVMVVVIIVIVFILIVMSLDFPNPGRRSHDALEIEEMRIQQAVQVHIPPVALDDFRLRLELADDSAHAAEFLGRDLGSFVQQNLVAEFYLLNHEILYVVFVYVLALEIQTAAEFALHPERVHDRHYAVEYGDAALRIARVEGRDGADGLRDGFRLADAARLDYYVVESAGRDDVAELLYEVHLQGAADAAVLEGHKTIVCGTYHASLLYEVGIDVDFAYIVNNHREAYAFTVRENTIDQCGLSAAQITGEQQNRNLFFIHNPSAPGTCPAARRKITNYSAKSIFLRFLSYLRDIRTGGRNTNGHRVLTNIEYMQLKEFVLYIAIPAIVSLSLIAGCSGHVAYNPDLLSAETLMEDRPDSALYILHKLDTSVLRSPADKALYALLYTQAQDKNYIDSEDEDFIRGAADFYDGSRDDSHKALAFYYLARTQENKMEYSNAIISLLNAETAAKRAGDSFHLGLIYRSFSDIYNRVYNVESLHYAKKAYECFKLSGRTHYADWGLWDIGKAFNNSADYDSSLVIATTVIEKASANDDTFLLSEGLRLIATSSAAKGKNADAIRHYRRIQELGQDYMTSDDYQNIGIAYFNSGNLDSARYYVNMPDSTATQSWLSYLIDKHDGNYTKALSSIERENEQNNRLIWEIINQDITSSVSDYRNYETSVRENELIHEKRTRVISVIILILLIILVSTILLQHIKAQNTEIENNLLAAAGLRDMLLAKESEAREMQSALNHKRAETEALQQAINSLFEQRFATLDKLSSAYYECQGTTNERNRIYSNVMALVSGLGTDKKTLKELEKFVDKYKDNLMSRFRESFPDMKESDCTLFLYAVAGFSPRAISIFINEKLEVVYNRKSRLKQKIIRLTSFADNDFIQYLQ